MKGEKRFFTLCLTTALFVVALVSCAVAQSSLPSTVAFQWSTQTNPAPPDAGSHTVRGMAVNQTDGSIYMGQCSMTDTIQSKIVKLSSAGAIVWSKGAELKDAGDVTRVTIATNTLAGLAIDPLTGNLYVIIDGATGASSVHVLNSDGVWLSSFATGTPVTTLKPGSAFGGAFSDDGQKYLIAGMLEKLPGSADARMIGETSGTLYGGKLFTRNDNGTPADPSDDTWDAAAELTDNGEFCSGFMGPQGTAFDRLGRAYVSEGENQEKYHYYSLSYVRSYDATAPYQMSRCIVTGGSWALATDDDNNIWAARGREPDAGTPKRIRCYSPDGIRLLGFVCSASGGTITEPMSCAYDRLNDRIIVGGTAGNYVYAECWTPTLVTPDTVTFTGRVVDKVTGEGIPYANVGYRTSATSDYPAGGTYYPHGYWQRNRADANGYFSFTKNVVYQPNYDPAVSYPIVPVASAPDYLSKRVYAYQIGPGGGDEKLVLPDIALDSADVDSITCRIWGKEGMFDPQFEESGLFWTYVGDGNLAGDSKGDSYTGRLGSLFSAPNNGWYDRFAPLLVDDEWMKDGQPFDKVWISMDYWNESVSPGPYDTVGMAADVVGGNHSFTKKLIGSVFKSDSYDQDWYTAVFPVDNAYFGNRQLKGTDLRVDCIQNEPPTNPMATGYSRDWVRQVTISKVPPEGYTASTSISAVKLAGSGAVALEDKIITSQWNNNTFYIEEPSRASGIRVVLPDPWVDPTLAGQIGLSAHVIGTVTTDANTGEPEILASSFGSDIAVSCGPLGMNNAAVKNGLDPTGLKASAWGVVSNVTATSFDIDDGAGGVKVIVDPSVAITWPADGYFVSVVGIITLDGATPETAVRAIKPWAAGNVLILHTP